MDRIKALLKDPQPRKWLFYGDSITHGALHTFGQRDYTQLFAERVRFELKRSMDVVINTAISGNSTRQLLEGFDWRLAQFKPDVVLLMIGMNDCSTNNPVTLHEFHANLTELANRIAALGSELVLQTTCPILPNTAPDRSPHIDAYMEAIRQVATERNLPLVDHYAYWKSVGGRLYYWMSNEFHPNAEGHRAFAHKLFAALDIFDPQAATCRLLVP